MAMAPAPKKAHSAGSASWPTDSSLVPWARPRAMKVATPATAMMPAWRGDGLRMRRQAMMTDPATRPRKIADMTSGSSWSKSRMTRAKVRKATPMPATRGRMKDHSTAAIHWRKPATSARTSRVRALEPARTEAMKRS